MFPNCILEGRDLDEGDEKREERLFYSRCSPAPFERLNHLALSPPVVRPHSRTEVALFRLSSLEILQGRCGRTKFAPISFIPIGKRVEPTLVRICVLRSCQRRFSSSRAL